MWAACVEGHGFKNVWQLTPDLYRGPQPTPEQLAQLKNLGVKTILNVRARHEDSATARALGIDYVQIPITAYRLEHDRIFQAMQVILDPGRRPVYIHCTLGGDRTGLLAALYRILVQDWSKDEAIEEMTDGYNFLPIWQNMIWFIRDLDVTDWRRRLNLPLNPTTPHV
jgi:uncharacterized protein (TIGR01244 family)